MTDERSPRLIDYHLHTAVTVDGMMGEAEACERARARGIREIAFTNHVMPNQPAYLLSPRACLAHWDRVQVCQTRYPDLGIRLGIELDYHPGREQELAARVHEYEALLGRPFDLVLGSVHELNGVFFSNRQRAPELYRDRDLTSLYFDYFRVATQAVRSGLFDVMAHPDLIKKYACDLTGRAAFPDYRAAVEPYVQAMLESGVGMELNTKGLMQPVKEAYPAREILALYLTEAAALRIDPVLTMGSDAHSADEVGVCLNEGVAILRSLGVTKLASFQNHARSTWEL